MALDPEFAKPIDYRLLRSQIDRLGPQWLHEEIGGLESDIADWEKTSRAEQQIPALQREVLVKQRDIAEAKLKIMHLRAQLGGAA